MQKTITFDQTYKLFFKKTDRQCIHVWTHIYDHIPNTKNSASPNNNYYASKKPFIKFWTQCFCRNYIGQLSFCACVWICINIPGDIWYDISALCVWYMSVNMCLRVLPMQVESVPEKCNSSQSGCFFHIKCCRSSKPLLEQESSLTSAAALLLLLRVWAPRSFAQLQRGERRAARERERERHYCTANNGRFVD